MKKNNCKLCQRNSELCNSHITPCFIAKWLKKTSITGFFRKATNMNKREQDLAKEYWLCKDCEGLFCKWEDAFAKEIFYPYIKNQNLEANYSEWMSKFCASLSWRTLIYVKDQNHKQNKTPNYINARNQAEMHLAKYLLNQEQSLNQYEQHLFPLSAIESSTNTTLPKNINRYFLRAVDLDVVGNTNNVFIYTKLPFFILLGIIKSEKSEDFSESKISENNGTLKPRTYTFPDGLMDYVFEKAVLVSKKYDEINPLQLQKIENYVINNKDKVTNSKTFNAFLHDLNLFGNNVFKKSEE